MNYPKGKPLGTSSITSTYAQNLKSTSAGNNSQTASVANSNDETLPFTHIQWFNLSNTDFTISIGSSQQGQIICPRQSAFLLPMKANSFAVSFSDLNQYVNAIRTDDK